MHTTDRNNKVISLARRISEKQNSEAARKNEKYKPETRVIAITSGKGGVGKTNIVANLGYALSCLGKKVLLFDADLGLGNIDVLLGLAPRYNLSHVIMGEKSIPEIIVDGPGNIKILPASSGIHELTNLSKEQQQKILSELNLLVDPVDILLIDTAAGISSNVIYFNVSAHEIMVVASPEPTSITDAYALMKVLSLKYSENHFKLLINSASSIDEADDVFRQLQLVANRFLDISIEYMGYVLYDKKVVRSVKQQKIVCEKYPGAMASVCFMELAKRICESPTPSLPDGSNRFFWKNLFMRKYD
ncbi:MAG: MinD/ParA family protein [Desulfosarcina sp.]|nr:MinD/ParA family protein [Desulfobacterales bacterium]